MKLLWKAVWDFLMTWPWCQALFMSVRSMNRERKKKFLSPFEICKTRHCQRQWMEPWKNLACIQESKVSAIRWPGWKRGVILMPLWGVAQMLFKGMNIVCLNSSKRKPDQSHLLSYNGTQFSEIFNIPAVLSARNKIGRLCIEVICRGCVSFLLSLSPSLSLFFPPSQDMSSQWVMLLQIDASFFLLFSLSPPPPPPQLQCKKTAKEYVYFMWRWRGVCHFSFMWHCICQPN